ncbi:flagellar hook-length control protein [Acrasis kona]|uniref:Flagellar hook-length control protein n=1 Tax=Acrasis kona TaxID=1008807 RepID=A0AAW2ZKY8_9EUKA
MGEYSPFTRTHKLVALTCALSLGTVAYFGKELQISKFIDRYMPSDKELQAGRHYRLEEDQAKNKIRKQHFQAFKGYRFYGNEDHIRAGWGDGDIDQLPQSTGLKGNDPYPELLERSKRF